MNFNGVVFLIATLVGQSVLLGQQKGFAVSGNGGEPAATADSSKSPEAIEAREESRQRLETLKRAAAAYEIHVGRSRDTKAVLRAEPLLRWNNQVRYSLDGATFLWTVNGRPHVIACIYSSTNAGGFVTLDHEFQSLSTGPIRARRHGKEVWFPAEMGVVMEPLPDAPTPGKTATLRLIQMRRLASRFMAICFSYDPRSKEQWQLRLMPQPLHRYSGGSTELADGGLFAFAHGTDPEVILVLEAGDGQSGPVWNYGLARICGLPLEVRLGEKTIWKAPLVPVTTTPDPSKPYITFHGNRIAD